MFKVYEVFKDGKKYLLHEHEDRFECECWVMNNNDLTNALRKGYSELKIQEEGE